jgi:CheY-like chemotaxis protein
VTIGRIADVAHLLVVEDDETIGKLLADGLHAHGHQVTWVRTGRGALREANTTSNWCFSTWDCQILTGYMCVGNCEPRCPPPCW